MREPDGWWGHIPVFIETLWKVRDYADWYLRQLRPALAATTATQQESLAVVPAEGFYVRVVAGVYNNELICGFLLLEDLEAYSSPRDISERAVAQATVHHPLADLGTDANPFQAVFGDSALNVPARWNNYVKWRRQRRWSPVPQWLVKLRAEERKAKRRQPREA